MSTRRLFDVTDAEVVEAAGCTYCGVGVGDRCREFKWFAFHLADRPHAQRWRDFWNATHNQAEQTEVYAAPWAATPAPGRP